uniref:Uncharacterized protein AlNc14C1G87 n=1 Tax=Albugo laibachii Nc14 TaxID=890382 RepID=F0VYT5_9STRA|nr:conserved hypothetical protein [Albugo laibachii Nc14]|eukprot:CCA13950.1 conserved hypothetical protein [Albugo laibachii Nc14]
MIVQLLLTVPSIAMRPEPSCENTFSFSGKRYLDANTSCVPIRDGSSGKLNCCHDNSTGENELNDTVHGTFACKILCASTISAHQTGLLLVSCMMEDEAIGQLRQKLEATNVLMRYDYAWKEAEFSKCSSRMTGVACRLLYLQALWKLKSMFSTTHSNKFEADVDTKSLSLYPTVYVECTEFPKFTEHVVEACRLMDFQIILDRKQAPQADVLFFYVPPPSEKISDNPYEIVEQILDLCESHKGSEKIAQTPMLCFLAGDSELLPISSSDALNTGRSLAEMAITQTLNPILKGKGYENAAHFAIEFVRPKQSHISDADDSKNIQLEALMTRFGCSSSNLMHQTEKWKIYVQNDPIIGSYLERINRSDLVDENEEETAYWEQIAKSKACDTCHSIHENLFRCTGCRKAVYCSQSCQKDAWKLHKHICKAGKIA